MTLYCDSHFILKLKFQDGFMDIDNLNIFNLKKNNTNIYLGKAWIINYVFFFK
jgi:hypothetical protein